MLLLQAATRKKLCYNGPGPDSPFCLMSYTKTHSNIFKLFSGFFNHLIGQYWVDIEMRLIYRWNAMELKKKYYESFHIDIIKMLK